MFDAVDAGFQGNINAGATIGVAHDRLAGGMGGVDDGLNLRQRELLDERAAKAESRPHRWCTASPNRRH